MKELRHFINHCTHDNEFWNNGGIPTKENQYIEAIGLTEDELAEFYDAMCKLQMLNKKIARRVID